MNRLKKFIEDGIAVMMFAGFAIRKFKKVIIGGITMGVIVVFAIVNVDLNSQNESKSKSKSMLSTISLTKIKKAMTSPEYIGVTDTGSGTKRLRPAYCQCPTGAYGSTFRCHSQGTGEQCTAIQQGSNACYESGIEDMLCEGTFVYRF